MKVLVLGAGGMLGHKMYLLLRKHFNVFTATRKDFSAYEDWQLFDKEKHLEGLDINNEEMLFTRLADLRPDVVINCIGVTTRKITSKNSPLVLKVNSVLPHNLQFWAEKNNKFIVHFSTDCVFTGLKGNYKEDSVPDASDLYGLSKRIGEIAGPRSLTIRSSIIGREIAHRTELIEWLLSQKGKNIKGYTKAIYSGVTTNYMSYLVRNILLRGCPISGLYQLASPKISKFDLLSEINKEFNLGIQIEPEANYKVDKSLVGTRLFQELKDVDEPEWNEMIRELKEEDQYYSKGSFHDFKG